MNVCMRTKDKPSQKYKGIKSTHGTCVLPVSTVLFGQCTPVVTEEKQNAQNDPDVCQSVTSALYSTSMSLSRSKKHVDSVHVIV